jgi:hypothetical protein
VLFSIVKECLMAEDDKKAAAQRPTTATGGSKAAVETVDPAPDKESTDQGHKDGVFLGDTRYEGTVLVDREIDGEWVSVMTDKPREGDRIQAHTLNVETGKRERSAESSEKAGAARMPGRA